MADLTKVFDVAVIDEIQMIGYIFSNIVILKNLFLICS